MEKEVIIKDGRKEEEARDERWRKEDWKKEG